MKRERRLVPIPPGTITYGYSRDIAWFCESDGGRRHVPPRTLDRPIRPDSLVHVRGGPVDMIVPGFMAQAVQREFR